jgi:hypothetical protein
MYSPTFKLVIAKLALLLLLAITFKQVNANGFDASENEIEFLRDRLCKIKIIDTSVYFIETYASINPTYDINKILTDVFLKNQNRLTFKRIIDSSICNPFDISLIRESTIKNFIKAYTDSLVSFEKASTIPEELKRDLCYYYHSAWNLFHHANKDHWDFDENLLSIYHIHRSYIGVRINNRIAELKQQIRLDSIQSKVYSLQTDIESSRLIGEVRFDRIDTSFERVKLKLDALSVNQERSILIAPYFQKGKWLQRSQQLNPDTISVLTTGKKFRKGKKGLKKHLRTINKQILKDTLKAKKT